MYNFWRFEGRKNIAGSDVAIFHSELDNFEKLVDENLVNVGDGVSQSTYAVAQIIVIEPLNVDSIQRTLERAVIAHDFTGDRLVLAISGSGHDLDFASEIAVLIAPQNHSEDAEEPKEPLTSAAAVAVKRQG